MMFSIVASTQHTIEVLETQIPLFRQREQDQPRRLSRDNACGGEKVKR